MITNFIQYLNKKSVVYKTILINCIFICFTMVFLIYNNIYIKGVLKREYVRNMNYVNYMSRVIEGEINTVKKIMLTYSFEQNIGSLSRLDKEYRKKSNTIFNIWKTRDTLRMLKNNSDIILDIYLYLPKIGLVINTQGSIEADIFFNNIICYENINIFEYLPVNSEFRILNDANTVYQRENNKTLYSSLYIYPISSKNGFVYVAINKRRVNSLLTNLTNLNLRENCMSFITDSNGEIVASNINQLSTDKLDINFKRLLSDGKGIVRLNSIDYYAIKNTNNDSIYQYFVLLPNNTMVDNIKKVNTYTLWGIVIFMLITLSIAVIQNIGIYIPLEQLIRKLKIDLNNKENEYKVLKCNYHVINTKCSDMKRRIEKQKHLVENSCFAGIFLGVLDENDSYIRTEINEINYNIGSYVVIKCFIEDSNGKKPPNIISIFEKRLSKKFIFNKIYSSRKEDIYVIKVEVESYRELLERLKDIYMSINKDYGVYCMAGISTVFDDINLLKSAYNEADIAINLGENKHNNIFEYSQINVGKLNKLDFRLDDEQELIYNVLNGYTKGVENILNTTFSKNMDMPIKRKKSICSYLITILKFIINSKNIKFEEVFKSDYEDIIDNINNIYNNDILISLIKEHYLTITQLIFENRNCKGQQIIEYINSNYNKDLYLELLAQKFDVAPGYMSAYFKNITGTTFLCYLQKLRINKAKDMLIQGDKKIYEIASEVGYRDVSNFITSFKKLVGTTPGEFVKNI